VVRATTPLVSVIVPAFNAAGFLGDSVRSVLSQTMDDLECIVVDDGSTDGTVDALGSIQDDRLRVLRRPTNEGSVSFARNHGLAHASGRYVAFLDADDWWFPEKLETQLAFHEQRPELGLVYCGYATTDRSLARLRTVVVPAAVDRLRGQVLLEASGIGFASTALIPAQVLREVGGFATHLSVSEDIDLAERIASRHPIAGVPRCLALYRVHGSQNHHQLQKYEHDMAWILDDRFGAGGASDQRAWLRGRSNLYTRLAIYNLRRAKVRPAMRAVVAAARHDPVRLVALPASAALRRVRQRIVLMGERRSLQASLRAADRAR
jgi:glycosyltransferase involved in cell wall biosynthesis